MRRLLSLSSLILVACVPHARTIDIGTANQVIVDDQAGKNNVATYNFFKALNKANPTITGSGKLLLTKSISMQSQEPRKAP